MPNLGMPKPCIQKSNILQIPCIQISAQLKHADHVRKAALYILHKYIQGDQPNKTDVNVYTYVYTISNIIQVNRKTKICLCIYIYI